MDVTIFVLRENNLMHHIVRKVSCLDREISPIRTHLDAAVANVKHDVSSVGELHQTIQNQVCAHARLHAHRP